MTVAEFLAPNWIGQLHRAMPQVEPRMHISEFARCHSRVHSKSSSGWDSWKPRIFLWDWKNRQILQDEMLVVTSPEHHRAQAKNP